MPNAEVFHLLALAASRDNVLALTSACDFSCLFCSHRSNPPGIRVARIPALPPARLTELIGLLDAGRPVVLGESTTRIVEGEPFLHPHIDEILAQLRAAFPHTPLQITTHGGHLSERRIESLVRLMPLRLILSLNLIDPRLRRQLLGEGRESHALAAPARLADAGIPYLGSVVAMIRQSGLNAFEETVETLLRNGASHVRVFIPGFTAHTPEELRPRPDDEPEVRARVRRWQNEGRPVSIEPPRYQDGRLRIAAVEANSPAARAGFCPEDELLSIDGRMLSDSESAWREFQSDRAMTVGIRRDGRMQLRKIDPSGQACGLILAPGLSLGDRRRLAQLASGYGPGRILLCTSRLAAPLWQDECPPEGPLRLKIVENRCFGGNIACAGLLIVDDFRRAIRESLDREGELDRVYLPPIAFDDGGLDLTGHGYWELEEEFGFPVRLP